MLSMVIDSISSFMYSKLLVIMLIGTGVYFTIRTKFPQVRLFRSACKAVMEKPDDEDAVSSFQALMVSTASRVGTGNIVGVSSAICIGGFGAVFWMWVIAIIGSASAFVESTLAQIYKKKGEDGTCYGGPAYYIEAALRCRPTVSCSKGKINGIDVTEYKVTGLKYIPVKVKTADYDAFKKAFKVVENGEKLFGGYAENNLSAYEETAEVNANTNGLKTATKDGDTFTFSARANGTTSHRLS